MTIIGGNATVMKQMFGASLLAIAAFVPLPAWTEADEQDGAALVRALGDTKATLENGLKASEQKGRPISAKFEIDDGRLQLSVYTMQGDGFSEVIVDPVTSGVAKAEQITDSEDLKAATAQRAAVGKATVTLLAAAQGAVQANRGSRAVSILPDLKDGHPVAQVTLLQAGAFTTVSEKLD